MPFEPGETFDRYTIEALIGEGGMGTVYRAYDPRLDRRVALKVLRTDRAGDGENATDAAARMTREARTAAALEHANCVAIFDVGEHEGTRFIAMEYVDGSPLRRFVGDPSVPFEHKTRWLVDVARALAAAHKRGLIHRDVKPENVMVRTDGAVKVLDFGIAKRALIDGTETSDTGRSPAPARVPEDVALAETAAGTVAGTPLYMAPEQVRRMPLDARADQFAWGVVAYELLTGQHPFRATGSGAQEILLAILGEAPVPIGQLVPHLAIVVQTAVMRALSKSRGERFGSMDEIVMALEPFGGVLSGRSLSPYVAPPGGIDSVKTELAMPVDAQWTRPSTTTGGRRRAWAIGASLAAVLALGAGAVAHRARLGVDGRDTTARPDSGEGNGLAMTSAEAPSSRNADALAAYREGLASFRAASFEAARQAFARAAALDPAMAAAHLRIALLSSLVASETEARESFRRAVQYRASLASRDQALLDAFEPYLQREPSDISECARRLDAAVATRPDDAELRLFLGTVLFDAGEAKRAESTFDRAITLDPGFAQAWSYRGATQSFLGEFDQAIASFDRCLSISIGATDCLWYRVLIHDDRGECAAVEADARTWIAKAPDDSYAYHALARALFALGKGEEAVRAALEQAWAHADPLARDRVRIEDELRLAVMRGDFAEALARGADLDKALTSEPNAAEHARVASVLVEIDEELGRGADAAKVAADFLARRDAWVSPTRVDDIAISMDPTPAMLAVEAVAGKIAPDERDARRKDWLRAWAGKTSPTYFGHLWIYGYATSARTPADAKAALDALPRYEPLPKFLSASLAPSVAIGDVYLLAGRAAEALPPLERARRACTMLEEPVSYVHASLGVGRAREATGDTKRACDAYGTVIVRWGESRQHPRSADEARKAIARLRCGH